VPTTITDLKGHPGSSFVNRVKCRMILFGYLLFFSFGYLQLILLVIDFYESNYTFTVVRFFF